MTYKLTDWGKTREALVGVRWEGELTDHEFHEANKLHGGLLVERGYFEKVEPAPEPAPTPAATPSRRATAAPQGAADD